MTAIVFDIGTTTLCSLAVDTETGQVLERLSTATPCIKTNAHLQDPAMVLQITEQMYAEFKKKFLPISCIGVTGQMHGILYTDADGMAVSPLYTWQDKHGDLIYRDGITYVEYLAGLTDAAIAAGYGLGTHFYMQCNSLVPPGAAKLCTIGDYLVMRLTNSKEPLAHVTNAASLGLFKTGYSFDEYALKKAGIGSSILPAFTAETKLAGSTKDNVPVSIAIGDNQASFLGSVANWDNAMLANIGTGSQISYVGSSNGGNLEMRPFFESRQLSVGAGLCGGSAYALLEKFFHQVLDMAGCKMEGQLFKLMKKCLPDTNENPLRVSTKFSGTRTDPGERGSIEGISYDNFTPGNLVSGFLSGIAAELRSLLQETPLGKTTLVASGGAVRENPALVRALSDVFRLPVRVPIYPEEAAYGAALFTLTAIGRFTRLEDAGQFIHYL